MSPSCPQLPSPHTPEAWSNSPDATPQVSGSSPDAPPVSLGPLAALSQECWAILDGQGQLAAANPAWQQQLGWSQAALLHQSWLARVHPADLAQTRTTCRQIFGTIAEGSQKAVDNPSHSPQNNAPPNNEIIQLENRYQTATMTYCWMRWSIQQASPGYFYLVGTALAPTEEAKPDPSTAPALVEQANHLQSMAATIGVDPAKSLADSLSGQAARLAQLYRSATSAAHLPNFPESYASLFESLLKSLHPNLPYDVSGVLLAQDASRTQDPEQLNSPAIHLFLSQTSLLTPMLLQQLQQRLLDSFCLLRGQTVADHKVHLYQSQPDLSQPDISQQDNSQQDFPEQTIQLPEPKPTSEATSGWKQSTETLKQTLESQLLFPLVNRSDEGEQIMGLLFVAAHAPEAFTEDHIQLLYSAAEHLSSSLQQLQLLWFKTERQHLNQILNQLPVGIVLLDSQHCPFFENEFAKSCLLDLGIEEQDGKLIRIGDRTIPELFQCPSADPRCREIIAACSPDLVYEVLVKALTPELDQGDWMLVIWDVSDRRHAATEAERALSKEKDVNLIKSRILRTVSHGYRSPLTSILGSAQILKAYPESLGMAKNQHLLGLIEDSARHLNQLVDEMLGMEALESGRLKFRPKELDLVLFCNSILEEARLLGTARHRLSLNKTNNCRVACLDPNLLRQILTNLLSNAIKYSPKGGRVQLSLDCSKQWVTFCIIDEGIGIPLAEQGKLFQSFYRASNADCAEGSGLGLNITRKFIELHRGKLTFQSQENVGSQFRVRLPNS